MPLAARSIAPHGRFCNTGPTCCCVLANWSICLHTFMSALLLEGQWHRTVYYALAKKVPGPVVLYEQAPLCFCA